MKHASLRPLSSPAAFRAGDAPVDLHEPGEKEVPQGCRERPGSQCDGSRPCSASQSGARTRYGPAQPRGRACGAG
jgi:hypothetical protein